MKKIMRKGQRREEEPSAKVSVNRLESVFCLHLSCAWSPPVCTHLLSVYLLSVCPCLLRLTISCLLVVIMSSSTAAEGGEVESERDPEALNTTEEPVVEPARGEPSLSLDAEEPVVEPARGEPSLSLDDVPTPLASVQTSPTRHPQSKSEVRYASSYPSLSSLEHLPPLLSYDEGDGFGRSPSLHGSGGLLSEQEQVCCVVHLLMIHC